jgi:thiamine-monophosphate kinase
VTISELTERELVARIEHRLPRRPSWMTVGIGDDAAVVEPERNRLEVLSVDALVEGIHFDRRFTPPDAIGHRALAVNLSDLAAMGAAPRLALLSFALPPALACDEFDGIVTGLAALASRYSLHVAGGNLTKSPGPLILDVTIAGTVKRRQVLTRSGARPGDEVYVSGTIGAGAAGLRHLSSRTTNPAGQSSTVPAVLEPCIHRYLYPEPRVKLGLLLGRNRAATACVDLSDGLADGLRRVGEASAVGMEIDECTVPLDPGAAMTLDEAMAAGDDYELLFTARPRSRRLRAAHSHAGVQLTRIGVCTANRDLVMRGGATRSIPQGYGHFR